MTQRSRKLIWPQDGQTAEASGALEVCALVLMVFFKSRFGWGLLLLIATATGLVSSDMLSALLGRIGE